ncbi:DUF2169 family type VI secretion system accessory protein [Phyllobacterium myrsinacearum]|uniref:DUF2169 domain-containing protein n=1 Tax=Phyllobacterium myrsinacearum TaxID=28101 RepID=A0A2S9JAN5_9HYPH|nr:DUF2169 domain-containing protein [Phyllobacterium myrsinacearum]PRD49871.1 hypothetical protein C5750_23890 [Phyllobacterium myrsinacearum]RZU97028.1 hypothetical protein EV654_5020 [Phyllobacterium myrsinacearum]
MSVAIRNFTPFANMRFSNTDSRGHEFGVFMVKATFDIGETGQCVLSQEQDPFNFTDLCYEDVNISSLYHPSDFVSYKPATDIIVNAIAHAPEGKAAPSWLVGVRVADNGGVRAEKIIRVTGPRVWVPEWKQHLNDDEKADWRKHDTLFKGWQLSEPEPIVALPIRYEYAYGGTIFTGNDEDGKPVLDAWHHNPLGRGWIDKNLTDFTLPQSAPQLENPQEPVSDPYRSYAVEGLGAIPPAWLPRRTFGGTYDQAWLDNIWPRWPEDYDFSYNNSAAAGLVVPGEHIQTPCTIELAGLRPETRLFQLSIPDHCPCIALEHVDGTTEYYKPALDTVFLDVLADDLLDCRLMITWRLVFHEPTTAGLILSASDSLEKEWFARHPDVLRSAPKPDECAVPCDLMAEEEVSV